MNTAAARLCEIGLLLQNHKPWLRTGFLSRENPEVLPNYFGCVGPRGSAAPSATSVTQDCSQIAVGLAASMVSRGLLPTPAGMRAGIPASRCLGTQLSRSLSHRMCPITQHMQRQAPAQRHAKRCQGARKSPLCMAQQVRALHFGRFYSLPMGGPQAPVRVTPLQPVGCCQPCAARCRPSRGSGSGRQQQWRL